MTLEDRLRAELLVIRKSANGLTVAAMQRSPVLCGLLGDGNPAIAYNKLKHAILATNADLSLKAAMSSLGLTSTAATHLERLDDFGTAYGYEQRQVRRYSDDGVRQLATLIAQSWATEAVPCLDVFGYQTADQRFAFVAETRCQDFVEMQPLRVVLHAGDDGPIDLQVQSAGSVEGIWNRQRFTKAVEVEAENETSLVLVWRGELFPKFSVNWRTAVRGYGLTSETLGNKLMLRFLPALT